jgi:multidrug efflux pump subunit AcrA (membrane-fusion protein)
MMNIKPERTVTGRARQLLAVLAVGFAGTRLAGEEARTLALVRVQSVYSGEVVATGRVVPQFTATIGSRLAAPIAVWGTTSAGAPFDVGMQVQAGELLFTLDQRTFKARSESAQAALGSAQAVLADLLAPTRPEQIAVQRATVAEWDARLQDRQRDEERYRRLVEVDKTVPAKRLEEAVLELAVARSQRAAAQARLDEALAGPTKTQIALAESHVKEAEVAVRTAQLDLQDTEIKAPFAGVIVQRFKGLGDYVAGAPFVAVLELTSVARLEAELRLPEAYLPQIVAGETRISLALSPALGSLELAITRVVRQVDREQGTFAFRVAIPLELARSLVPGAFVTGRLQQTGSAGMVIVPQQAVVEVEGRPGVMVAEGGKMVRRDVEIASRLTEGAVVSKGLLAGDAVVIGPLRELKDGAALPAYLLDAP